jgi:hypothetical protein
MRAVVIRSSKMFGLEQRRDPVAAPREVVTSQTRL